LRIAGTPKGASANAACRRCSSDPSKRARAIVEATTHYDDADIVAKVSRGLGEAMRGEEIGTLDVKLAERGW